MHRLGISSLSINGCLGYNNFSQLLLLVQQSSSKPEAEIQVRNLIHYTLTNFNIHIAVE